MSFTDPYCDISPQLACNSGIVGFIMGFQKYPKCMTKTKNKWSLTTCPTSSIFTWWWYWFFSSTILLRGWLLAATFAIEHAASHFGTNRTSSYLCFRHFLFWCWTLDMVVPFYNIKHPLCSVLLQPATLCDPSASVGMKRLLSTAPSVEPRQRRSWRKDSRWAAKHMDGLSFYLPVAT